MLPGMDGYEVCKRIRQTSQVPIIMLSAKGETFDKVLGLELGADDYVQKPFDNKELVARVKAALRRSKPAVAAAPEPDSVVVKDDKAVQYRDLYLSLTNYTCIYRGENIALPPKEFELLFTLASHPNQVFNREQLLDKVWGYDYIGDTRTVDVHIKRVREKIHDGEEWAIGTVWGVGYKFEVNKRV
jgi:DNA-binding response OmpR family regulator